MKLEFHEWLQTVPKALQPSETSICTAGEEWSTIIVTRGDGSVTPSLTLWGLRVSP